MQLEHNPMQLWPKPKNLAVKERSSIKNMTLRSRLQAYGVKSGVKGRDERHRTAPLTPPTSLEMSSNTAVISTGADTPAVSSSISPSPVEDRSQICPTNPPKLSSYPDIYF